MHKLLRLTGCFLLASAIANPSVAAENIAVDSLETAIPAPSPRIVGGYPTSNAQTPATAALLRAKRVNTDGDLFQAQFCGGTVIAERWVLTAAHCVVDAYGNTASTASLLVLTGSADLSNPVNQPIPVKRIIPHPLYRSVQQGRDIALIELIYDSMVEPVALDTQPLEFNDLAYIAGWGALNGSREGLSQAYPRKLRGTFVYMTPGTLCGTLFEGYEGFTSFASICAGVRQGGRDSCQGDSGGPLYRIDTAAYRVSSLAGVTSWGIGCGEPQFPGIYTRVSSFIRWIQATVQDSGAQLKVLSQPANDDAGGEPRQPIKSPTTLPQAAGEASPYEDMDSGSSSSMLGAVAPGLLPLMLLLLFRLKATQGLFKPGSPLRTVQSAMTRLRIR